MRALRNKVDDYFRNSDYDGIILKSDAGSFGRNVSSYVVFDPVQVKSAVNNNGNFDPYNPNTLFQTAYHGSAANFEEFNTDSYGLSGEGSMSFGYGAYLTDSKDIALHYAERQGNPIQYRINALTEIIV